MAKVIVVAIVANADKSAIANASVVPASIRKNAVKKARVIAVGTVRSVAAQGTGSPRMR